MDSLGRWTVNHFKAADSHRDSIGRARHGGLVICAACVALLCGCGSAFSGPCTAQIAALERQIEHPAANPAVGPTLPQTLDAQLHQQPTPREVAHAEHLANKDGEAALARAKAADAAGNAAGCHAALARAKDLYEINR